MGEIVEMKLASGEAVFIEVLEETGVRSRRSESGTLQPMGRGADIVEKAEETFEAALEKVKPAAEAVVKAFKELNEPDEIGLEFGVQLTSSANAFFLTGKGTATFKLSLKWKSDKA